MDPSVGINTSKLWTPTLLIVIVIVIVSIIKTIYYKYKNFKRPADDQIEVHTDRHIILSLRVFYPIA